eukprot:TRINITY_DN2475_c0_g1_i1.p1 TRINITY_DN2475_c0_g1~~TRINITY_DN2475_c0_g1_i1.p1  ORF type:complete len:428 (-),score=94.86 TRINITY_DN2475_c0_g1_i1:607-1839(-)
MQDDGSQASQFQMGPFQLSEEQMGQMINDMGGAFPPMSGVPIPPTSGAQGFPPMPMGGFPEHIASMVVDIQEEGDGSLVEELNAGNGAQASVQTTVIPLQVMEDGTVISGGFQVSGEAGIGGDQNVEGEGIPMDIDEGEALQGQEGIAEVINEQLRQALSQIPQGQNPSWSPGEGEQEETQGQTSQPPVLQQSQLESLVTSLMGRMSAQDLERAEGVVQNIGSLLRHVTDNWDLVEQFLSNVGGERPVLLSNSIMQTVNRVVRELQQRIQAQRQTQTGDTDSQPSTSTGEGASAPKGMGKGLGLGKGLPSLGKKSQPVQQEKTQQPVSSFPVVVETDDEDIEVVDVSQPSNPQPRQGQYQQQQSQQSQQGPTQQPASQGPGDFLNQILGNQGGGSGGGGGILEMAQKNGQ